MTIQAKCPGCQASLRIPSDWVHKSVRCKKCGTIIRVQPRAAAAAPARRAAQPAPPPRPAPSPTNRDDFAALEQEAPAAPSPRRAPSRSSWKKLARAALWLVGLVGIGGIVYVVTPSRETKPEVPSAKSVETPAEPSMPVATGPFPRRLLTMNVCNYLYFDPIQAGQKPRDAHTVLSKFSDYLHVASGQFLELSDAAPGKQAVPPLKGAIEKAITDFLGTSRPQDRVLLLFSGHAVEIEDQPYLVPLEGEAGDAKSLIPLAWLYEQLRKCPAQQKVLVADLCHVDPSRGAQRPGSGPLGEKIDAALQNPPPGVQVWSSCVAGQFSYDDGGSIFLSALNRAIGPGGVIQQPTDPLPLERLNAKVGEDVQREVGLLYKEKQTTRLSGSEPGTASPYDPNEPPAPKLTLDWKPSRDFAPAAKGLIDGILREAASIPPVKVQPGGEQLNAEMFPLFSQAVMKDYQPNNAKSPFRDAILQAGDVLKKHAKAFPEEFHGDLNSLKKRVAAEQKKLALTTLELEDRLKKLQDAGKQRDQESSKRWRASYDFMLARLLERIAYTYEYNFLLANIRTESMPELVAGQHTGWRLASREKMQAKGDEGKQAKKYASDAKDVLKKLAEEHRGTPYEVLAKRDASNALGLEWRPTR